MHQKVLDAFQKAFPKNLMERFFKNPEAVKVFQNLSPIEERGKEMIENMQINNIQQILPMTFASDEENGFLLHKLFPKYFPGTIPMLSPDYHTDPTILQSWKEKGAVAVKFYPAHWSFGFNDERLGPYLDQIRDLGLGILVHFGVVKGGETRNTWPSNPLELRPWLTNPKFEDLKFIVCHFGAGHLQEVLMMGYGYRKQIAVDTSGSNDWLFNSPWSDLNFVFQRSIEALGPENVFFGTDSNTQLLRKNVIDRQIGILEDLVTKKVISDDDRWNILGGNTRKFILKN
jgi:hypothetical protein